jgi:hypothetical protein
MIQVSPFVVSLAKRLARSNTWDTLCAFWAYFFEERKLGSIYHHALNPNDPLSGAPAWLDCFVGSALFVALARASSIPARMVRGQLMYPRADEGHHFWSEAFLPPYGWVPFDLHGWILAAGDLKDARWGKFLCGHLPHQLVLHRLPASRLELGLRYPPRWYSITKLFEHGGQENALYDLDTHALVVRDRYEVTIGDAP